MIFEVNYSDFMIPTQLTVWKVVNSIDIVGIIIFREWQPHV